MAHVTYFVYCKDVQVLPNEKDAHLIGPMHMLNPRFVPSEYSFSIAFGIMDIDLKKDNFLKVVFKSPTGEVLFQFDEVNVGPPPGPVQLPPEHVGIQVNLRLQNVPIKLAGMHTVEVVWNKEAIFVSEVPVIQAKEA